MALNYSAGRALDLWSLATKGTQECGYRRRRCPMTTAILLPKLIDMLLDCCHRDSNAISNLTSCDIIICIYHLKYVSGSFRYPFRYLFR